MAIIGVVPARGGSKSIPKKSIAPCAGKPLLVWTAEAARASRRLDRLLLSTDDAEIASVGAAAGLEVPFLRPSALAQDDSPMIAMLAHMLDWLAQVGTTVDALVLLQPTSPLRTAAHIDEAIDLFTSQAADTVVSVTRVPHRFVPNSQMKLVAGCLVPLEPTGELVLDRHAKPELYARNGPAILVLSAPQIRAGALYSGRTLGYVMSERDSLDVDEADDLALADLLLSRPAAQ